MLAVYYFIQNYANMIRTCIPDNYFSETLEKARGIAEIAKYKSDFSLTEDETIKAVNISSSPSSSTCSMPLFSDPGIKKHKYHFYL